MNKIILLLTASVLLMLPAFAQNIGINEDGSRPNGNAILDLKSGNKGLLIPRMDSLARKAIPNTKGLLVYDISTDNFWYNTGEKWECILNDKDRKKGGEAWSLLGNANTVDGVNFLGTTDNVPLNIRVNNQPSGRIDSAKGSTFWGYKAGALDTANNNTAIGSFALASNIGGEGNVADGYQALYANKTGTGNTAVGYQSLYNTTVGTLTATGYQSLYSNTTGQNNNANGYFALYSNTTGNDNTATGFWCLRNNTTGYENTADGTLALYSNTTGLYNVAVGANALFSNTTANYNTAVGMVAMTNLSSGGLNTAVGNSAMYYMTAGVANTAIGIGAMEGATGGNSNTAIGGQSLSHNSTGQENVAIGEQALVNNTTGAYNVATGESAMQTNITGSNNTTIGFYSDVARDGLTNATAFGNGAIVDASNKVRIGNSAVTVIEGQVPFTTPSDGRYKFNVRDDVKGLDFILHLRPVTYQFDTKRFDAHLTHQSGNDVTPANLAIQAGYDEATRIRRSGFIAQEVEQAANASGYDFSGIIKPKTEQDHYSLSYDAFVVPLVKAVQEQQQIILEQNKKLEEQNKKLEEQDKKLTGLQARLDKLEQLLQPAN